MKYLAFIGDVHGKYDDYIRLASRFQNTIQVGDMGFDYSTIENHLDPNHHVFIAGNHDNYSLKKTDYLPDDKYVWRGKSHFVVRDDIVYEFGKMPLNALGHFGVHYVDDFKIFFVRGAYSIDKLHRTLDIDYFIDEELSYQLATLALEKYSKVKPNIVVSHDCPFSLYPMMRVSDPKPSITSNLLEQMFLVHQPKIWIFGHHHMNKWETIGNTNFICLNELSCVIMSQDEKLSKIKRF